jgi:pyruvate/2-oxoglutarate dehydrogenase complex dihydrolipoamide acyltransferase (E2) component
MAALVKAFPAARKQTYAFLEDARRTCHVYLMTDVDATRVKAARAQAGGKISFVSYVVKAAADVIAAFPDARAVLSDGLWPTLTTTEDVHAKVLFDKTIDGQRCVVSGTVRAAQARTLAEVQADVDTYKAAEVDADGPFKQVRMLQRLPLPLARLVYRVVLRSPQRRSNLQGTFSVTSVGHENVRAIIPMIAGTLGFGVGRIAEAAVVRDGKIEIASSFTLSLAFDHRVLDGAISAEVLARVKDRLECWGAP